MNRRLNGESAFADEADYAHFSQLVRDYKELCGAKVYHWTWMGTHYHMLIEVVFANLRPFVGGIQQTYAQYYRSRHGGAGIFWQGRFKSKPVEVGGYLVSCGRYIERNPVRAGMVMEPWDYTWTSAAHYVKGVSDGITDSDVCLGQMEEPDRKAYGAMLLSGVDDTLMQKHRKTATVGAEGFAGRFKVERGRHRLRRGRPVKSVRISS
jgi:putative transposase